MNIKFYDTRVEWWNDQQAVSPDFSLGGTSCASVMGASKYRGPWDVWKYAKAPPTKYVEPEPGPLTRGMKWEAPIAEEYAKRTGMEAHLPLCRVWCDEAPWLRVSPDAFVCQDNKIKGLAEVKTVSRWEEWGDDGLVVRDWDPDSMLPSVPKDYAVQGICQMIATGLPWCDFVAGGIDWATWELEIRVIRFMAQPSLQDTMLELIRRWRDDHLVHGKEPEIDGSDACNSHLAGRKADGTIELEPQDESACKRYIDLGRKIEDLEATMALEKNMIMHHMREAKRAEGEHYKVTRVRVTPQQSLSANRVKKEAPEIWEQLQSLDLVSLGRPYEYPKITRRKMK